MPDTDEILEIIEEIYYDGLRSRASIVKRSYNGSIVVLLELPTYDNEDLAGRYYDEESLAELSKKLRWWKEFDVANNTVKHSMLAIKEMQKDKK